MGVRTLIFIAIDNLRFYVLFSLRYTPPCGRVEARKAAAATGNRGL